MVKSSDLEKYFQNNNQRLIHKWHHYFNVYERHFSRYRNKPIVLVEIGVSQGGSLQMWKDYFGNRVKIYGIDIDERCKDFEEENIEIFIGSQSDATFLQNIKKQIPKIDILIDDGGHTMEQQIVSFEHLYSHVKSDGIYLCEDTHTSYSLKYGGGHKRRGTFIEYSKNFIDNLHAYHSEEKSLVPSEHTQSFGSVHFYEGIVVVEKNVREEAMASKTGTPSFKSGSLFSEKAQAKKRFNRKILFGINHILRRLNLKGYIWK